MHPSLTGIPCVSPVTTAKLYTTDTLPHETYPNKLTPMRAQDSMHDPLSQASYLGVKKVPNALRVQINPEELYLVPCTSGMGWREKVAACIAAEVVYQGPNHNLAGHGEQIPEEQIPAVTVTTDGVLPWVTTSAII